MHSTSVSKANVFITVGQPLSCQAHWKRNPGAQLSPWDVKTSLIEIKKERVQGWHPWHEATWGNAFSQDTEDGHVYVCLYFLFVFWHLFWFGFGCLEIHLRYRNGKHMWMRKMNIKQSFLKSLYFFKQQSHQTYACLFVLLCTTLNLWIIDQWCSGYQPNYTTRY